MNSFEYDPESDALYVYLSRKKVYYSLEISPCIAVDLTENNRPVGVEILDVSQVVGELLGHAVSKKQIQDFLTCHATLTDAIYIHFELGQERAALVLPQNYQSPILTVNG